MVELDLGRAMGKKVWRYHFTLFDQYLAESFEGLESCALCLA